MNIDWDMRWYKAWQIIVEKLTLEEIKVLANVFDVTGPAFPVEEGETEEENKRYWISAIGTAIREQRQALAFRIHVQPLIRGLKELLGIYP